MPTHIQKFMRDNHIAWHTGGGGQTHNADNWDHNIENINDFKETITLEKEWRLWNFIKIG